MSDVVFSARDATVRRGGRVLLDGVSLDVAAGEVVAVLGENGAGKSTLLRLFAGDFAPDGGEVSLLGRPLSTWSALEQARRRAVLPQQTTLAFAFTAFDVALMGRSPHDGGRPGARDRAIVRDALALTDALAFADRPYPTLSGGERARVLLARAFAQILEPDGGAPARGLLLDEPAAALDIAHQHAAFAAVGALAQAARVAVVVVVHDPNLAAGYADRVALLKRGALLAAGPADALLDESLLSRCFSIPMRRLAGVAGRPVIVAAPEGGPAARQLETRPPANESSSATRASAETGSQRK